MNCFSFLDIPRQEAAEFESPFKKWRLPFRCLPRVKSQHGWCSDFTAPATKRRTVQSHVMNNYSHNFRAPMQLLQQQFNQIPLAVGRDFQPWLMQSILNLSLLMNAILILCVCDLITYIHFTVVILTVSQSVFMIMWGLFCIKPVY